MVGVSFKVAMSRADVNSWWLKGLDLKVEKKIQLSFPAASPASRDQGGGKAENQR